MPFPEAVKFSLAFASLITITDFVAVFYITDLSVISPVRRDPAQLTARCAPGLRKTIGFKGVRGHAALRELIRDAFLPDAAAGMVHMGVFSSCLGRRLQTSPGGYIENRVSEGMRWMDVGGRSMDQVNVVRLVVVDWGAVGLAQEFCPAANDLVVTCRGSVLHRFLWNGPGGGLEWTPEAEAAVVEACQRVADAVGGAC